MDDEFGELYREFPITIDHQENGGIRPIEYLKYAREKGLKPLPLRNWGLQGLHQLRKMRPSCRTV